MTDSVSIANAALTLLEADQITSLDDAKTNAKIVKAVYARVYDYVLRQHPWNCAMRRAAIPAESAAPAFGFARQFPLPTDPLCLRLVELVGTDERHEIEGRKILTDAPSPLKIRYVARVTEDQLDADCAEAIAYYLAVQIAPRVKNTAAAERMLSAFEKVLARARSADAMECSPPEQEESSIIQARW